jgi:hypothetical protein
VKFAKRQKLATLRCVKRMAASVSLKRSASMCARAIAVGLSMFGSVSAQSDDDKPEKTFWPRQVTLSEAIELEQKTKYSLVTAKRSPGNVVKVIGLDSDVLTVESEGFSGKVSVRKTDFWERAERTRNVAIERKKRAEQLVRERQDQEAAEKMKATRLKRYEAAPVLQLEIIQVLNDGCLARVLNDNHKRIFIELRGANLAQGQQYEIRAGRWGTFKYTTVLGAPSTVERWAPLENPN